MSLGTKLPSEMARVRDVIIPLYESIGPTGQFAIALMKQDLDTAAQALAEGDLVAMISIYKKLREIE